MQILLCFICYFCKISCLLFTLTERQSESLHLCSSVFMHAFSACALLCMLVNSLNCRGSLNHRQSKNKQIHQRCLTGYTVSSSSLCNVGPVTESQLQELRLPQKHYGSCYWPNLRGRQQGWWLDDGIMFAWPAGCQSTTTRLNVWVYLASQVGWWKKKRCFNGSNNSVIFFS